MFAVAIHLSKLSWSRCHRFASRFDHSGDLTDVRLWAANFTAGSDAWQLSHVTIVS